jgi:putative ABC transport system ATP-binding protein
MILELENITKSYQLGERSIPVVLGVNMTIEKGEFVAIMGPSGSGKSTLLHILGLLDSPTTGRVLSNKKDLSRLSDTEQAHFRSKMIGFIFQSFQLLPQYDALSNVVLPLVYGGEYHRKDEAKQLLERLGLGNRLHHKPSELSGGERQRVAICRALINHPQILLADEPSGSLDTHTGNEIMDILMDLHLSGLTIVMVTHEPRIGKKAQRLLHFRDGKVTG